MRFIKETDKELLSQIISFRITKKQENYLKKNKIDIGESVRQEINSKLREREQ